MRFTFILKTGLVIALVAAFDRLVFAQSFSGTRIGLFAGLWLIGMGLGRRDVRKERLAWIALVAGALFAISLFDDPGPLA